MIAETRGYIFRRRSRFRRRRVCLSSLIKKVLHKVTSRIPDKMNTNEIQEIIMLESAHLYGILHGKCFRTVFTHELFRLL